jgi:hypothetical protein
MSDYDRHGDLVLHVQAQAEKRCARLAKELKEAFQGFIKLEAVEVVFFLEMSAADLASAFLKHPGVMKPVIASCNIAARAIERDLDIRNVNTYKPRLTEQQANQLAGYLKPFLPPYIAIPALCSLDQYFYIDKEIRASKGRWEKGILESLNKYGKSTFRKRKFKVDGQEFELDAAAPAQGAIEIGIDVKRIEARRDIHKRCDEIVNKASKFRAANPTSKFAAVVYYPFVDEHVNVQNRLKTSMIDSVVFAGTSSDSIDNAVRTLLINCEFAK